MSGKEKKCVDLTELCMEKKRNVPPFPAYSGGGGSSRPAPPSSLSLRAAASASTAASTAPASKGSVLQLGSTAAAVGSWATKSVALLLSMNVKSHRALGLGWSFRALVLQFCASAAIWKCGESALSSGAAARLTTLPLYGYSVPIFAIWGYARLQFLLED